MKIIKSFTSRMLAVILAGTLTAGSLSVSAFAADDTVDFGDTSVAVEEVTDEEPIEDTATAASDTSEVADDSNVSVDTSENVPEEEAVTSYTVTLDANGGYFANELDDVLGEYVERTEILNKMIPLGKTVSTYPVNEQEGVTATFMGWSLERDGEIVWQKSEMVEQSLEDIAENQALEGYAPVDHCILYAVWSYEDEVSEPEVSDDAVDDMAAENAFEEVALVDEAEMAESATEDSSLTEIVDDNAAIDSVSDDNEINEDKEDLDMEASPETTVEDDEVKENVSLEQGNQESVSLGAALSTVASGTCGDNLTWTLDSAGTLTISGTGEMSDYNYQGGPWEKNSVKTIVVNHGVTSIGMDAFYSCKNLTEVILPDGITSIGDWAFGYCSKLTTMKIPESVKTIGFEAFRECINLNNITIPTGVTRINGSAFADCKKITDITVPGNVTAIEMWEFSGCTNLKQVTIKDGVSTIQKGAFYGCSNLSSIIIPASVNDIWEEAFTGCPSSLVIYGVKGSYAEQYAKDNGIEFRALDQSDVERKCLVYFDPNGGFNYDADPKAPFADYAFSYEYECGKEFGTLLDSTPPFKNGYEFVGWFTEKEGGIQVTKTSIVDSVDELTLYAHWEEGTYTVKFYINDGSGRAPTSVTYKGPSTYGTLSTPIHCDGHKFLGWFTDRWDGYQVHKDDEINYKDHNLYAHWMDPELYEIDTDNDGISNGWEIYGADTDGDGRVDIDFPSMGADYEVPDIFVEVDWMEGMKPSLGALKKVYDVFEKHHINLHIDVGPTSIDWVTGKPWGDKGQGNRIDYENVLDLETGWDSMARENFSRSRLTSFRYCVFINRFMDWDGKDDKSGKAENIPGQFFLVAGVGGEFTSESAISGTFMHELGHTLGLHHGGNDEDNYKPNYLSVMNYSFQCGDGIGINYSEYILPGIDEKSIDENKGIGLWDCSGLQTKWYNLYLDNVIPEPGIREDFQIVRRALSSIDGNAGGAIDFNCNGFIQSNISLDLNGDGKKTYLNQSQKDWDHLSFKGGKIGDGVSIPSEIEIPECSNPEWLDEMTVDEYEQMESNTVDYDDVVDAGDVIDSGSCGDNLTWMLDDNGTLTISGTGAMYDYNPYNEAEDSKAPWYSYRDSIVSIIIKNGITDIGSDAFHGCGIKSIVIPRSVKVIHQYAFVHCDNLINIEIPDSVTDIHSFAFAYTNIKKVTIPSSVGKISDYAFCGNNNLEEVIILDGVKKIGVGSFKSCTRLSEITIPSSVSDIASMAFENCIDLTRIYIPQSVTSMHYLYTFKGCTNLIICGKTGSFAEEFAGTAGFPFEDPSRLEYAVITAILGKNYTGKAIIQSPVVTIGTTTLKANTDYTVSYSDNTNAGTATVTITGKGNYTGTKTATFKINPAAISGSNISGLAAKTYTGKALTQSPVVTIGTTTLKANTDYTVSYSDNTNAGTATVTITGKGNYAGIKTATFTINKANQSITAKASASSIAVGKTTTVSITGAKGTKSYKSSDTSVATVNASTGVVTGKKAGTVTITATSAATSNYNAASKTVKITVNKVLKKPGNCHFAKWNNSKYTSCRIAWNKVDGADGYETLLSWTNGSHASRTIVKSNVLYRDCTVHPQHVSQMMVRAFYTAGGKRVFGPWSNVEYITPSPTKLTTKNASSGTNLKMNISWNIIYGCNGYNVFLTTNPNGTWYWNQSTSTKADATSAVITKYRGSKLKKNTRYYVRIVTRRQRNGVFCTVPMPASNTYVGSFIIK